MKNKVITPSKNAAPRRAARGGRPPPPSYATAPAPEEKIKWLQLRPNHAVPGARALQPCIKHLLKLKQHKQKIVKRK